MDEETKNKEDEINLLDLFAVLWRRKWMIIGVTLAAAIGVVAYSVISLRLPPEESYLPNTYTASAFMLISNNSSSGVSSMVGGLASLAGISVPATSSFSGLAIYLIGANPMLDSIVDEFDLITRYNLTESETPRASSRAILKGSLKAAYDATNGVFSISFTSIDPAFARDIANYCTDSLAKRFDELGLDKNKITKENLELNIANIYKEILELEEESRRLERSVALGSSFSAVPAITTEMNRIDLELRARQQVYTQLKVQYEMLKVEMASETPVFQILEMAEIPEMKSGPSRGMTCIIVTLAAGFFAVILAFVMNAVSNIRNDPGSMAKLRGKK
jgi:uncharacterized protein involved in exopolysaccharide biosynthesis